MSRSGVGGCLCGDVRYECTDLPESGLYCHCRNCQKAHSAPFAALVMVSPSSVSITKGGVSRYERTSDSGNMTYREFCPRCGTHLLSGSVVYPQAMSIKIITLDDPNSVVPDRHVWVENAVGWACMEDELPRFAQQPSTTEAFVQERRQ
jgi:hypothetical protein